MNQKLTGSKPVTLPLSYTSMEGRPRVEREYRRPQLPTLPLRYLPILLFPNNEWWRMLNRTAPSCHHDVPLTLYPHYSSFLIVFLRSYGSGRPSSLACSCCFFIFLSTDHKGPSLLIFTFSFVLNICFPHKFYLVLYSILSWHTTNFVWSQYEELNPNLPITSRVLFQFELYRHFR